MPSSGASGGILIAWNGAWFSGEMIFQNKFSLSIQFTCSTSSKTWILTNIYGPCNHEDKVEFIDCLVIFKCPLM